MREINGLGDAALTVWQGPIYFSTRGKRRPDKLGSSDMGHRHRLRSPGILELPLFGRARIDGKTTDPRAPFLEGQEDAVVLSLGSACCIRKTRRCP
jgi:hypothetical protein